MEERRKARRMRLESTITVKRIDSNVDEEVTIEIKDLSRSGIGFFCGETLEVGAVYQSSIMIWTKEIIPVLLRIVRNLERDGENFYGAEFLGLSRTDMYRIGVCEELDKREMEEAESGEE